MTRYYSWTVHKNVIFTDYFIHIPNLRKHLRKDSNERITNLKLMIVKMEKEVKLASKEFANRFVMKYN